MYKVHVSDCNGDELPLLFVTVLDCNEPMTLNFFLPICILRLSQKSFTFMNIPVISRAMSSFNDIKSSFLYESFTSNITTYSI